MDSVRMCKRVCRACLNAAVPGTYWHGDDWHDMFWDKQNDVVWKAGRTCCPVYDWQEIPVGVAPERCNRKLEHLVLGQARRKTWETSSTHATLSSAVNVPLSGKKPPSKARCSSIAHKKRFRSKWKNTDGTNNQR